MKWILLLFCAAAMSVRAATFTPTSTSDWPVSGTGISVSTSTGVISGGGGNGLITLRSAVIAANANSGSTINVPAGTYTLTIAGDDGNGDPNPAIGDLDVLASFTIKGAGPGNTIIQAGTNPSNGIDQIFTFNAFYTSTGESAVINGFSGTARDLTFRYGRVINNNTDSGSFVGGGISFDAGYYNGNATTSPGSLYVSNCVFDSCSGPYGAGAIMVFDGGTVTIDHCVFTNCVGGSDGPGGAICFGNANSGSFTVQNSSFLNNSDGNTAGAIVCYGTVPLAVHNCVFSNNVAATQGGAIDCDTGILTVDQGCFFIHNSSGSVGNPSEGGAIWYQAGSGVVSNCTFTGNIASTAASPQAGGGAIAVSAGTVTIVDCRFFGNVASVGSGVCKDNDTGTATAINNWWGNNNGPGSAGADSIAVTAPGVATSSPWLTLGLTAVPSSILTNAASGLTASITKNSSGTSGFTVPTGTPVTFGGTLGNVSPTGTNLASGTATSTFTAGSVSGAGQATVTVDNQIVTNAIIVNQPAAITSAAGVSFVTGITGSFTVTASGYPAPALSRAGTLPTGVTFTAATGVLTGAPAAGTGGIYPLTFTAINTSGTNNQSFQLTVNQPPVVTCPATITTNAPGGVCLPAVAFASGVTGFPAPVVSYKLSSTTIVSPYTFPIGTNVVTSTATNLVGTNTCSFDVKVTAGPAPQLSIARVGTNVVVSWNASYGCYTFQYASALASNIWNAYPGPYSTNGSVVSVTRNGQTNEYFFRLSH